MSNTIISNQGGKAPLDSTINTSIDLRISNENTLPNYDKINLFNSRFINSNNKLKTLSCSINCHVEPIRGGPSDLLALSGSSIYTFWENQFHIKPPIDVKNSYSVDFFNFGLQHSKSEIWEIIKNSTNQIWIIVTSHKEYIKDQLPYDWSEDGYPNVWIAVFDENSNIIEEDLADIPGQITLLSRGETKDNLPFSTSVRCENEENTNLWIITGLQIEA
jgi:hypothetical protein